MVNTTTKGAATTTMENRQHQRTKTFPWKLHEMLELADQEGFESIVSWLPNGRSFKVHNPIVFVEKIMPNFFQQTKYKSFQRQCKFIHHSLLFIVFVHRVGRAYVDISTPINYYTS